MAVMKCHRCLQPMPENAARCPHCGERPVRHHQHWPVWLAAFALLALLLGVGTALYRTAGPEPAREPAPAQEAQPQKPVLGS